MPSEAPATKVFFKVLVAIDRRVNGEIGVLVYVFDKIGTCEWELATEH